MWTSQASLVIKLLVCVIYRDMDQGRIEIQSAF